MRTSALLPGICNAHKHSVTCWSSRTLHACEAWAHVRTHGASNMHCIPTPTSGPKARAHTHGFGHIKSDVYTHFLFAAATNTADLLAYSVTMSMRVLASSLPPQYPARAIVAPCNIQLITRSRYASIEWVCVDPHPIDPFQQRAHID